MVLDRYSRHRQVVSISSLIHRMLSVEPQIQRSVKATGEHPHDGLLELFRTPPATHRPVPFYWWAGGRLERDRLAWQLDQLRDGGVRQVVVSYPHHPDGTSDAGDPAVFTAEWWDLFRWFLGACRARGMKAGFQDYTLIEPLLKSIGMGTPGMEGGRMGCRAEQVQDGGEVVLSVEEGSPIIGAWAYPMNDGAPQVGAAVDLAVWIIDGMLRWKAPAGRWLVAVVHVDPAPFDPMHPESGAAVIRELYQPFERECGAELGETLDLFFQDELDFGSRMPFWSGFLLEAFERDHGYDLQPWLPALWHDLGPLSEKVRIDYADTVVSRLEDCYFKPVFEWHEKRGILFGHDNSGRGGIAEGRSFYGDYFRTMRWFSAPGCDDPKIHGARAFKGLKVNASIARLNGRPRVWVEAFHSSGWGTTPAEVVSALNEDFAYGATVVNLHGLYYSTHGGWWEWAPPDFHFRQPYWSHSSQLNDYAARICWLLSQGDHRCNVAIVYPITSLHAEAVDPCEGGVVAHMGNEAFPSEESARPGPEEAAFGIGKYLFDRACDFDFIDEQSLERASFIDGILQASSCRYRVLIVPAMETVRMSMLRAALEFVESGGIVIAYGKLPRASDRGGRSDPEMLQVIERIFGGWDDAMELAKCHPDGGMGLFVPSGHERLLGLIRQHVECDVASSEPLQVLHREIGLRDVYYLFNPASQPVTTDLSFRAGGSASWWDAWTGMRQVDGGEGASRVEFQAREGKLLVFERSVETPSTHACLPAGTASVASLDGLWNLHLQPTLDNRHGDFELPATAEKIGPQARRFLCAEESDDGLTDWREATFSFGQWLEVAGPFPPESDLKSIERSLLDGSANCVWRPYEFSKRLGIERDPFLTDWLSGPHGLKGKVPDEFLDFNSEVPGSVWFLRASVVTEAGGAHRLVSGGRCAYRIWLNGVEVAGREVALAPGVHPPWGIPHYQSDPSETEVVTRSGVNELLIRLAQPVGQRTRAYFAFDPPQELPDRPVLRWFLDPGTPQPCVPAPFSRKAVLFRFAAPPGVREFSFVSRGPSRAWVADIEQKVEVSEVTPDGHHRCRVAVAAPPDHSAEILLRVEAPPESRGGDAMVEPVRFQCGGGLIRLGDWCDQGLATYSGCAVYSRTFEWRHDRNAKVGLDLGSLSATAEVRVNGALAATLIAPPWRCDITPFLQAGTNELSIAVANTLANHYSVGIPTPYAFPEQTPSGLFGPVTLIVNS